jgi:hypothetical protein
MGKFEKSYFVTEPLREVSVPGIDLVKGRTYPTLTYMGRNLVPAASDYLEFGWIWEMPDPNPHIFEHVHRNNDEIVLHIGSDPHDPEDLGAEIEFVVGGETLVINKTSAVYIPKGVKHGPLTWKSFKRPHIQMTIIRGAGTLGKAAPAGAQEKK